MRTLETEQDLKADAVALAAAHPEFAPLADLVAPLVLRRRAGGFAGIMHIILGQQVSTASARAHWGRMCAAGLDRAEAVRAVADADLRACGLSRQKIAYARHLAEAGFDFEVLDNLPDDAVIDQLMTLKGVGRWSAEIYAQFSLGRADIFAAGDLALQEAARVLRGLEVRPSEDRLREMAVAWSPNRTVAAIILWQYYAHLKSRDGVI